MRRFYTEQDLTLGAVVITGPEAYHMQTVLRLTAGDACILVNGRGQTALAHISMLDKNAVTLNVETLERGAPMTLEIAVLQGFLKERKLDDLVRPLSELGVTVFGAVFTERSVPAPDEKRLAGRLERWRKLAVEALKQNRNGVLMDVVATVDFKTVLSAYATCDLKLFLWEGTEAGLKPILQAFADKDQLYPVRVALLLGPEGGFSAREAALALEHGFTPVSLGPRILRSQTAALAAATVMQYVLGDLG